LDSLSAPEIPVLPHVAIGQQFFARDAFEVLPQLLSTVVRVLDYSPLSFVHSELSDRFRGNNG